MRKTAFILTLLAMIFIALVANAQTVIETGTPVDVTTTAVPVISTDHLEIHNGDSFIATFQNDVANATEMTVIAFNTPAATSGYVHMIATASSSGAADFRIIEAPSVDVDEGTQAVIYNRNRNSSDTSGITSVETTPVANKVTTLNETQAATANITETTIIYAEAIGVSGNPVSATGRQTRGGAEFVLKAATQYAVMLDATVTAAAQHNIILKWYE